MSKVGIIGTGRIGSHLAEFLLTTPTIKEIHLANRNKDRLEGRLISLQLRGHLLGSKSKVTLLDKNNINELDLIAICIKDNYDPRKLMQQNELLDWLPHNLRYVGFLKDLPLLESVCNKITDYNGFVAVLSNPVEINTYFVSKWLPNATVVGLGASVDTARISFILKNELNFNIDKESCIIAGEHGFDIIPIFKLWNQEKLLAKLTKKETKDCLDKATNVGFEIVNKLGFTLQDCAPVFADDIKWILGQGKRSQFRTLAIPNSVSCYSRPIIFDHKNKIVEFKKYSLEEIGKLKIIEERIAKFIKTVEANIEL